MALLESILQPSVAVEFAAGLVAVRYVASATGAVLRPLAKGVVKSALAVSDGVTAIIAESREQLQAEHHHALAPARAGEEHPRRKPAARAGRATGTRKARSQ